ncbi:hypothetical protein BOX15_Mlig022200g1, partial [Macrostomum lignano]
GLAEPAAGDATAGSSVNVQQREHGRGHRPRAGQAGRGAEPNRGEAGPHRGRPEGIAGHINSLSSMFGGVKNWFRGDSAKKRQQPAQQYEPAGASLDKAMAVSSTAEARRVAAQEPAASFGAAATGAAGYQQQQQRQQPQTSYDRAFSENLGEMEHGMGRLKQLAMGLGGEIDRQNSQLERMSVKTDKTNAKMDEQNTQMNRILYGSKAPPAAKK